MLVRWSLKMGDRLMWLMVVDEQEESRLRVLGWI